MSWQIIRVLKPKFNILLKANDKIEWMFEQAIFEKWWLLYVFNMLKEDCNKHFVMVVAIFYIVFWLSNFRINEYSAFAD